MLPYREISSPWNSTRDILNIPQKNLVAKAIFFLFLHLLCFHLTMFCESVKQWLETEWASTFLMFNFFPPGLNQLQLHPLPPSCHFSESCSWVSNVCECACVDVCEMASLTSYLWLLGKNMGEFSRCNIWNATQCRCPQSSCKWELWSSTKRRKNACLKPGSIITSNFALTSVLFLHL